MIWRKRKIPKIIALFALFTCVATVFLNQHVSAHANLLEASPKPSEELDFAPERVIIWFTEPIEPAFSNIIVLDPSGANVTAGETEFDPTEPTAMWVPLSLSTTEPTPSYGETSSTVDGHKVAGSFLFAVGEPLGAGPQVDIAEQPLIQSPLDPVIGGSSTSASPHSPVSPV